MITTKSTVLALVTVALVALPTAGCWDTGLPETADVAFADGVERPAPRGSGPPSLANTRWACYRADGDWFIARVEFGPEGQVTRFWDNVVYLPDVLGTEIIPDEQVRANAFPGMTYAAACYGGENESGFGFTVKMRVWLLGVDAGNGSAYGYGVRSGDRLHGTFGHTAEVVLLEGSPLVGVGPLTDQYQFYAVRE